MLLIIVKQKIACHYRLTRNVIQSSHSLYYGPEAKIIAHPQPLLGDEPIRSQHEEILKREFGVEHHQLCAHPEEAICVAANKTNRRRQPKGAR